MNIDLSGWKVVVTGGSRGIGRAIALTFAQAGAAVSICARTAPTLRQTETELRQVGHPVHAETCDLREAPAITRYIEAAATALDGIDVLVSNATGFENAGDAWQNCLDVDLMAAVRCADAALPHLQNSAHASIVNISSISGLAASVRTPAYAAAKAALIQYTTSQALALAPLRIHANGIAPGSVEFPGGFWENCRAADPALYQKVLGGIPLGRYGRPEEIAAVALFLASPLASWVTGHTVVADGGQILNR
ncbi:MAG TPA: SDR family oxidoreductase [Dongiaceae bacterium]|nr:SDR family oxidoreductase [Dongiaceae bacterium]